MKRKIIRLSVTDGADSWQHTRDSILSAVPPGKVLTNGTVWTGDLKPKLHAMLDKLAPLVTPFSTGQTLHAEELTGSDAILGRVWTGDLQARLTRAATTTGDVDLSQVVHAVGALHTAFSSGNRSEANDSIQRVRRAADAVRTKGRTADGNWGTQFLNRSRAAATPAIAAAMKRAGTADGATGAVRDAVATAGSSTDMRGKIAAINQANAAFWAAQGT